MRLSVCWKKTVGSVFTTVRLVMMLPLRELLHCQRHAHVYRAFADRVARHVAQRTGLVHGHDLHHVAALEVAADDLLRANSKQASANSQIARKIRRVGDQKGAVKVFLYNIVGVG